MGQVEAMDAGLQPLVVVDAPDESTALDTKRAAQELRRLSIDLLLFVGGDGTAIDILEAVNAELPVLGVPAGVKMHSAVFAITPIEAGRVAIRFLRGELPIRYAEVMDVDEKAYRDGRLSARLYGYLKVPYEELMVQGTKVATPSIDEEIEQQRSIAKYVVEEMKKDTTYILGPGTTIKAIADEMKLEKTLIGVDIVRGGRILKKDADERQILESLDGDEKIVVTPIGGQAHVFGRGNQQISPAIIKSVGKDNIIVVATRSKTQRLPGRRLLVDTGDPALDSSLRGYVRVITGYREETVMKID
jgi:predicted polyphosphate/ATP-dependent NAD kinase